MCVPRSFIPVGYVQPNLCELVNSKLVLPEDRYGWWFEVQGLSRGVRVQGVLLIFLGVEAPEGSTPGSEDSHVLQASEVLTTTGWIGSSCISPASGNTRDG